MMDDLICRQDAIDAITQYAKFLWETYHEHCNHVGMIDAITNVPSAQKKGHWQDLDICYMCSECGENSIKGGNFCPNCGADMRGGT